MPPSYGELPTPKLDQTSKENKNNIENLIGESKDEISQTSSTQNKNLEKSILDKIKNN